ncbi:MAG: DUF4190 domain-containing protein [Clostridiales bacterium]|nr:DUF4190 domain-containing protein [Clostridiales bacterium]
MNNEGFNNFNSQFNMPPQPVPESKGLALASMFTSIGSILLFLLNPLISLLGGITGIVLGSISLGTKKGGKNFAITGIACGGATLLIELFWITYLLR